MHSKVITNANINIYSNHKAMKKLNKTQQEQLYNTYIKLCKLYDKYRDNDIALETECNGTVAGNISCAIASFETILQEYWN